MEDRWNNFKFWTTFMAFIKINSLDKDKYGVKYKFPDRSCKSCSKYPCFAEISKLSSDLAKYGCVYYEGNYSIGKVSR